MNWKLRAQRVLLKTIIPIVAISVALPGVAQDTIRIWGHGSRNGNFAGNLVRLWEEGFAAHHAGVHFDVALRGDSAAMGGVYTGAADIALMGREIWPIELEGFEQATGNKPFEVSVMTGSLNVPRHAFALVIFVHKDNPLSRMTLAQVDAIFGADHRRGRSNIRTWGDLGLPGEWSRHRISLYGFAIEQDFPQFFQQAVMNGSKKWNSDLHEFRDANGVDAGQQILDALAADRYGIAISSLAYGNSNAKPIALSSKGDDFVPATRDTVMTRHYPLARPVSMVINRETGHPIHPVIKEYLTFVLSREGQQVVAKDGGYLPLPEAIAEQERKKLE